MIILWYLIISIVLIGWYNSHMTWNETFRDLRLNDTTQMHCLLLTLQSRWCCAQIPVVLQIGSCKISAWDKKGCSTQSTLPCFTKHAKCMTLSVLETSLSLKRSHDTLASGISAKNWCLEVIAKDLHHWLTAWGSSFHSQQLHGTQWEIDVPTRSHVFVAATHVNRWCSKP